MVEDGRFAASRMKALDDLNLKTLDHQLVDIVRGFSRYPHCYTVQSCYGHLVEPGPDGRSSSLIDPGFPPPRTGLYQLAYLTMVIENSVSGRALYEQLSQFPRMNASFFQWGSGTWFWRDQGLLNSYVLQVEPIRFRHFDRFPMDGNEARQWLEAREIFWNALRQLLFLESPAKTVGSIEG